MSFKTWQVVDTTAVTRASGWLFKKCYSVVVKLICEFNGWVVVVKGRNKFIKFCKRVWPEDKT